MNDTPRCEPPEHLRGVDGEHHIYYHPAGTNVAGNPITVRWGARAQGWWADHLELRGHDATQSASMGWRYLAPATPPAVVAALVEALEHMLREQEREGFGDEMDDIREARAALAAYREAGR